MLKRILMALVPLAMVGGSANADDLTIDVSSIKDADAEIVELDMDIDMDALEADAGEDTEENAIEACFRRYGYNYRSWGRSYGHWGGCYNRCYNYCRPLYSYRTINYCPPVCRAICTPVYSYYWGCH